MFKRNYVLQILLILSLTSQVVSHQQQADNSEYEPGNDNEFEYEENPGKHGKYLRLIWLGVRSIDRKIADRFKRSRGSLNVDDNLPEDYRGGGQSYRDDSWPSTIQAYIVDHYIFIILCIIAALIAIGIAYYMMKKMTKAVSGRRKRSRDGLVKNVTI
ncbi:MAG: hypothetical protein MHMPM18_001430 [Marteilia pararefringens]